MSRHAPARISIGQALADLNAEFPDQDIKAPKIRFLEAEGLVKPERTPSGYRKFSTDDMEKLRYIIRAQRDHYLPLKVIKEHLEAMDRGLEPPLGHTAPRVVLAPDGTPGPDGYHADVRDVRVSRKELLKTADIDDELLDSLEAYGLVKTRPGSKREYDADMVAIAKAAGELAAFGLEPRHLRAFKTAADREVGLVEAAVTPIRRSREDGAQGRAAQAINEIAALSVRLHAALVKTGLRSLR